MAMAVVVTLTLVAILFLVIKIYNCLVQFNAKADNARLEIDTQFRKRYDIIPKIVAEMDKYAKYDRPVLNAALEARSMAMGIDNTREKIGAEAFLSSSLSSLFSIVHKYPELEADQQFKTLQASLNDAENSIDSARRAYNAIINDYNRRLEVFPNNIVAKIFGLKGKNPF